MAEVIVDAERWPLVIVTLPEQQTDDQVRAYLDRMRQFRSRAEPYAIIVDANASSGFTARQRKMQAEFVAEGLDISRKYLLGLAFVAESNLRRGMLTAIFWLQRPAVPYFIFSTKTEAVLWARKALGLKRTMPPRG